MHREYRDHLKRDTSGRSVGKLNDSWHLVESDIRLAEVDRFVHLDAVQLCQFSQRLRSFHPISAIANNHLRPNKASRRSLHNYIHKFIRMNAVCIQNK